MKNINKHTARYQLSRFIQSEESFSLNLDFKDIALLSVIFDFMDSGEKEWCFADQIKLSKISRVPRSTIIERIKKLISLEIIRKERVGYKNYYYIGNSIKKYVQSLDLVSLASGRGKSSSGTLYNNKYKNNYNNVISSKNDQKRKDNDPKQAVKFWGEGHPDYDRLNKK